MPGTPGRLYNLLCFHSTSPTKRADVPFPPFFHSPSTIDLFYSKWAFALPASAADVATRTMKYTLYSSRYPPTANITIDIDYFKQDDVSRLLFDDPNNLQYGSFGEHNMNSQADPLESQREVEALQRVVARTSKYVSHSIRNSHTRVLSQVLIITIVISSMYSRSHHKSLKELNRPYSQDRKLVWPVTKIF